MTADRDVGRRQVAVATRILAVLLDLTALHRRAKAGDVDLVGLAAINRRMSDLNDDRRECGLSPEAMVDITASLHPVHAPAFLVDSREAVIWHARTHEIDPAIYGKIL